MTWLSEIEKIYGTIEKDNRAFGEVQLIRRMARVIRELALRLRIVGDFTHVTDKVWHTIRERAPLSPDAKEVIEEL